MEPSFSRVQRALFVDAWFEQFFAWQVWVEIFGADYHAEYQSKGFMGRI